MRLLVLAGFLVSASAYAGPSPPVVDATTKTFVSFAGQPARVALAWPAAHGVARYRVRWTEAGAPVDLELPGTATAFERTEPTAGHHQLSVIAIDERGQESSPAEINVDVIAIEAIAPGASEPAAPGSAFALGTRFASPGLRCRLGDGAFEKDVVATAIGATTLACGGEPGQPQVSVPLVIVPVVADAPKVPIARGVTTTVHVTLASVAPLGDRLQVEAIGDLDLGDALRTRGGFDVAITPLPGAKDVGLVIRGNGVELGRVELAVTDAMRAETVTDGADWYALDVGGHVGALVLPSVGRTATNLGTPTDPRDTLTSAALVGGRVGIFPTPSLGLESEVALALAGYEGFPGVAQLGLARAHLAARLIEDGRYGLRLLGGAGVIGVLVPSSTSKRGIQGEVHWGGAFSIEARDDVWVRIEALHVITSAQNAGYAHCVELQLGVVTRFGRRDGVRPR